MKKALFILILFAGFYAQAQIRVTPEGYPKFPKKEQTTTVSPTDTLMISKVDGIQMGISFADFTNGLGTTITGNEPVFDGWDKDSSVDATLNADEWLINNTNTDFALRMNPSTYTWAWKNQLLLNGPTSSQLAYEGTWFSAEMGKAVIGSHLNTSGVFYTSLSLPPMEYIFDNSYDDPDDVPRKKDIDALGLGGGTAATTTYDNTASGMTATNVKTGLDEVHQKTVDNDTGIATNTGNISTNATEILTLSTVPASQFGFQIYTSDRAAIANDALDSLIVKLYFDNENFEIPSGVFEVGQSIRISRYKDATNEIRITQGSGVNILGVSDGFLLGSYPSGATITRTSGDIAPEQWEIESYFDNTNIVDYVASSLGPELLNTPNFDTDTSWSKQNGSTISGGLANVIGNGAINASGANHSIYQDITALTDGTSYRLTFTGTLVSGSGLTSIGIKFNSATVIGETLTGVETTFSIDFVAGSSNYDRVALGADLGTTISITSVSLKEIL